MLVIGLHVLNPDALIVRTNAARTAQTHQFDAVYAVSLSADAVPALVASLPSLPPGVQQDVTARLLPLYSKDAAADWRSWNWGRQSAFDAVQSQRMLSAKK